MSIADDKISAVGKPRQNESVSVAPAVGRPRIFFGWWIVAAGCTLWMFNSVYIFTFGMFLDIFSDKYGWSMASLSAAYSIGAVSRAILGPAMGYLVDRFGPRRNILVGVILTGISFLLVQFITSISMFYLIFGFLLSVSSAPIFSGGSAAVTNWFQRRRAFAISLLTTAWVGGGAIIAPSAAWLINNYGWQFTATMIGVIYLATGIPLSLVMRHKPEPYGYLPDGDPPELETPSAIAQGNAETDVLNQISGDFTPRQALKTRAFWMLALSGMGFAMATSAVTAHQIPMLTHRGFDTQTAANALGLMALFSALGRPIMGYLGDRYNKRLFLAAFVAITAAGVFVLGFAHSMNQVYLYAFLYGVGFAVLPLNIAIVADYFGRRFFATIQQTILALGTVGFAIGPFFVGLYFDSTQEYKGAFIIIAAACLAASLLYLFNRKPALVIEQRTTQRV